MEKNNPEQEKIVLLEGEKDKLLQHDYDGIKELDFPLPRWWIIIFALTVIHSAIYFAYYHLGEGPSIQEILKTDLAQDQINSRQMKKGDSDQGGGFSEEELKALMSSDGAQQGEKHYQSYCLSCHGTSGKGDIGPNLTDNFWLNGRGEGKDLYQIVSLGVADKGMPAWGTILGPKAVMEVTAYLLSLKGTNVQGGKAPQGNEIK